MSESLPFGSHEYFLMLSMLFFGRSMDFFSTWVATPNLALEGNPIAKKLGWRWGVLLNIVLCVTFARWPVTAVIITTTGLLVAARNFHSAWLMRSMGEEGYRVWYSERVSETRLRLVVLSLLGETVLTAIIGVALLCYGPLDWLPTGIAFGIIAYAIVVLFYTSLSLWRTRRVHRQIRMPVEEDVQ